MKALSNENTASRRRHSQWTVDVIERESTGGKRKLFSRLESVSRATTVRRRGAFWGKERLSVTGESMVHCGRVCTRLERRIWGRAPFRFWIWTVFGEWQGPTEGWRRDCPCRMLSLRAVKTWPGLDQVLIHTATWKLSKWVKPPESDHHQCYDHKLNWICENVYEGRTDWLLIVINFSHNSPDF